MSLWVGENLQWSKVIFWFRLYLVFYHRSVGEADMFSPGHGLYCKQFFQGRISNPSGSISTGDIGLRWKRFSEQIHAFQQNPLQSPGSDIAAHEKEWERGNEQGSTGRTREEQVVSGQRWAGFSSPWCTRAPPWHPPICVYTLLFRYSISCSSSIRRML